MTFLILTGLVWIMSLLVNHNWWFVICITVSTALGMLRLKAVLFRFKTIIRWEIIAVVIPLIFSVMFKRFHFWTLIMMLIVRGMYIALLYYDFKTYIYPHETIVVGDEEED